VFLLLKYTLLQKQNETEEFGTGEGAFTAPVPTHRTTSTARANSVHSSVTSASSAASASIGKKFCHSCSSKWDSAVAEYERQLKVLFIYTPTQKKEKERREERERESNGKRERRGIREGVEN